MEERLSALFELRVGEMREETNDKIEKQRVESEKQIESLRSNMA